MHEDMTRSRDRLEAMDRAEIQRAVSGEGCPICSICNEHLQRYYFWFLVESYADGSAVGKYIDYWGFCAEHTKMLAEIGPVWQKSAIYRYIIDAHLPKMEKLIDDLRIAQGGDIIRKGLVRRHLKKDVKEVISRGACIFCESTDRTAFYYVRMFLRALEDPEIRQLYQKSDGLCMQHFFWTLKNIDPKNAPGMIDVVRKQIDLLRELKTDFQEFFRKADYRFSKEPRGMEQTTWVRAVKRVIGSLGGKAE